MSKDTPTHHFPAAASCEPVPKVDTRPGYPDYLKGLHALHTAGALMVETFRTRSTQLIGNISQNAPFLSPETHELEAKRMQEKVTGFMNAYHALDTYVRDGWGLQPQCTSFANTVSCTHALLLQSGRISDTDSHTKRIPLLYSDFRRYIHQIRDGGIETSLCFQLGEVQQMQSWVLAGWYADHQGKYGPNTCLPGAGLGHSIDNVYMTIQKRHKSSLYLTP
ncbi:MAG: hypothetical protein V4621_06405 [Pseudomonadota bacterium]